MRPLTSNLLKFNFYEIVESERKTLPKFDSIEDLVEFFDENDLGDYLENMPEVEFEVNL